MILQKKKLLKANQKQKTTTKINLRNTIKNHNINIRKPTIKNRGQINKVLRRKIRQSLNIKIKGQRKNLNLRKINLRKCHSTKTKISRINQRLTKLIQINLNKKLRNSPKRKMKLLKKIKMLSKCYNVHWAAWLPMQKTKQNKINLIHLVISKL